MQNSSLGVDFFKDILERQNNPIVRVDAENRFLYISKAYADYFGLDESKMIGEVYLPQICEEDVVEFERIHRQIKESKQPASLLQREFTKNGWVWFEWKITPILDANGEIKEVQSVGQDVSNLIATKDTLNLIFRALEQTSAAVIITDIDGLILYANIKFKQLYGYEDEDVIGKNPRILRSELTDASIYEDMWKTILQGKTYNCELTNKAKNGVFKWVLLSISPIKNEDGLITHFVAVSEDIGFQKRLEGELRNAKKELENINEALEKEVEDRTAELRLSNMLLKAQIDERKKIEEEKEQKEKLLAQQSKFASLGEMINMIAHQWRQPLTAISTAAINIKTKQELGILNDQTLNSILDGILSHTQKMSGTINDFLNFFKPAKNKEYFDIQNTYEEAMKLIGAQLSARGIKIEVDIENTKHVYGFKNELEQVFINVLSNARDAFEGDRADKDRLISIRSHTQDSKIVIEIIDNAGGVDESVFDRVFEPYFTTKESDKGTGIGLYMSKTILQKSFGGDMQLENIYESGVRVGLKCIIIINQEEGLSDGN